MQEVTDYTIGKVNIKEKTIGFVMKAGNIISAYIPTLMSEIQMGNAPWVKAKPLANTMIKNNNMPIKFNPVKECNFLKIQPHMTSNMAPPSLAPGEKFYFIFLDGDIKKPRYLNESTDEDKRSWDVVKMFAMAKGDTKDPRKEYEFVMDSKNQQIKLSMEKARGEVAGYSLDINGMGGTVSLGDDAGQSVHINTKQKTVSLKNSSGTAITLSGDTIHIYAKNVIMHSDVYVDKKINTEYLHTRETITYEGSCTDVNIPKP